MQGKLTCERKSWAIKCDRVVVVSYANKRICIGRGETRPQAVLHCVQGKRPGHGLQPSKVVIPEHRKLPSPAGSQSPM